MAIETWQYHKYYMGKIIFRSVEIPNVYKPEYMVIVEKQRQFSNKQVPLIKPYVKDLERIIDELK